MQKYVSALIMKNSPKKLMIGPSHAIDITWEAIREGADAVVAVGGDGTLHEVVNGFFWGGKPITKHDSKVPRTTSLGVMLDPNGNSRGSGFVAFSTPEEASQALAEMSGKMVVNKPLYVALAQRKEERRAKLHVIFGMECSIPK
ncbi:hypothetical protein L2E82_09977 [Cichorium intybus]|uniref:Uncharacterized protein n=1 Tax=Cichorium intybus TaxID=13427 RepID=A0ACB9G9K5_CICIN|nr:hypothetical protein L2E82_09977 [Cichorium intybus]